MQKNSSAFGASVTLLLASVSLAACAPESKDMGEVVLSYEQRSPWCANCPHYRVEFSSAGTIRFIGFSGCAVPGEQVRRISHETFAELRQAFNEADFFALPRLDTSRSVTDTDVVTIAYRDDRRVHEVIDTAGRSPSPRLTTLRERLRDAARPVDPFVNPSVDEYQRLLAAGWKIDTIGTDGENALTNVVARDPRAARFLLDQGATVSRAAVLSAVPTGDVGLFRSLIAARHLEMNSTEARDLLVRAAGLNTPITTRLLDAGTDPNSAASEGTTALAAAVSSGSADRVGLLLSRGADPRRTANVVRAAVSQDDSGIITLLTRRGADVNAQDAAGRTALIVASDLCRYWHIEALLEAGADPLLATRDGRTALQPQTALAIPTESCRRSEATLQEAVRHRQGRR